MGKLIAATGLMFVLAVSACSTPIQEQFQVDLDGDGTAEAVSLSHRPDQVTIIVRGASVANGTQTLSFGVDPARQDAVCGLPVVLEISEPDCMPEVLGSEPLEGCKANPRSKDLSLSDGMCDSIHMYWNHDQRKLWWWRL